MLPGSEIIWEGWIYPLSDSTLSRNWGNEHYGVELPLMFAGRQFLKPAPPITDDYRTFDFDTVNARLKPLDKDMNALNPENVAGLAKYFARGGKIVMNDDLSDQATSPTIDRDFYDLVVKAHGGPEQISKNFRLFFFPGGLHDALLGGEGSGQYDRMAVLEAWVMEGKAPEKIEVSGGVVQSHRTIRPYPAPPDPPAADSVVRNADKMLEYSSEARFQLDFHVNDAALLALLPPGFTLNVATQGPPKDANLRVVFIDRLTINGPDGKPAGKGTNRLVYLVAPVKDPGGAAAQLVVGGLTEDPSDAPGPFANYLAATIHSVQRSTSNESGPILDSQDWIFAAPSGEHLEMHIKFERGVANKGNPSDVKFYSAKNPGLFQVSHQEQVLETLRNTTTNPPDRVKEFSFKGSGGSYSMLFDGTERLLSWDDIIWVNRSVMVP
jgi:hypothetical protein